MKIKTPYGNYTESDVMVFHGLDWSPQGLMPDMRRLTDYNSIIVDRLGKDGQRIGVMEMSLAQAEAFTQQLLAAINESKIQMSKAGLDAGGHAAR